MSKEPATNENEKKSVLRDGLTYEQVERSATEDKKSLKTWKTRFTIALIVRVLLFVGFVGFWVFEMIQEMKRDPEFSFNIDRSPQALVVFSCIELTPVIWAVYFYIAFSRKCFDVDKQLWYYLAMEVVCKIAEIALCSIYFFASFDVFTRAQPVIYISIYILPVYFFVSIAYHGLNWYLVRKIQEVECDFRESDNRFKNFYNDSWWEPDDLKD